MNPEETLRSRAREWPNQIHLTLNESINQIAPLFNSHLLFITISANCICQSFLILNRNLRACQSVWSRDGWIHRVSEEKDRERERERKREREREREREKERKRERARKQTCDESQSFEESLESGNLSVVLPRGLALSFLKCILSLKGVALKT